MVCIANQKGGVGKTTTCVNVGAALALDGLAVLIADLDPQANATTGLGLTPGSVGTSVYDVVEGDAEVGDALRPTAVRGLDCLPASADLAGAEIELVDRERREHRLADALAGALDAYDIVFVDCPPSLGLLTVNAMVAARHLLVPVQCEFYALEAVTRLIATKERITRSLNPDLVIGGFVLTMYDGRTKLAGGVAGEMRSHFGDAVFDTVVPRSVRLSEAPSYGEPVVTFDPSSRGAAAYRAVASELAARLQIASTDPGPLHRVGPVPTARGYGAGNQRPPGPPEGWPRRAPWGGEARDGNSRDEVFAGEASPGEISEEAGAAGSGLT